MRVSRILSALAGPADLKLDDPVRIAVGYFLSGIANLFLLVPGSIFAFIHAGIFVQTGDIVIDSFDYDAVGRYLLCLAVLKLVAILIGIDGFIEKIKGEDSER